MFGTFESKGVFKTLISFGFFSKISFDRANILPG